MKTSNYKISKEVKKLFMQNTEIELDIRQKIYVSYEGRESIKKKIHSKKRHCEFGVPVEMLETGLSFLPHNVKYIIDENTTLYSYKYKSHIIILLECQGLQTVLGRFMYKKYDDSEICFFADHVKGLKNYLDNLSNPIKIEENEIPKISFWVYENGNELNTNVNIEFFLKLYIRNGVFKPDMFFKQKITRFLKKPKAINVLLENDVKLIILNKSSCFDVKKYFGSDIKIDAPVEVIEMFKLKDICVNDGVIKKVKENEQFKIERDTYVKRMNTFTLVQDGKSVLVDINKEDLINYLQYYEVKDEYIKTYKITCDADIDKELSASLEIEYGKKISYEDLIESLMYDLESSETDSEYCYRHSMLDTGKYVLKLCARNKIRDYDYEDTEIDDFIQVNQVYQ